MIGKTRKIAMIVALAAITATTVWAATDYSTMSNEELSKIRGTLHSASLEERNAFRTEWRQRVQNMTPEEQQQYLGHPACGAAGGSGGQQGNGYGNGRGMKHGMGYQAQ